jgi:uncharacterized protein YxeA
MKKAAIILLVVAMLAAVCVTAYAVSADTRVQATLSPSVTVKYNGVVQTMRNANGDEVFPVMYQGTTYLPIRAVSNMLGVPVDWDGGTRTVLLGAVDGQGKSFLDAADGGRRTTSGNISRWVKTVKTGELPMNTDGSGNLLEQHTEAVKTDSIFMSQVTKTVFKLDGRYASLGFTAYNTSEYVAYLQIFDFTTGTLIWEATLDAGESLHVPTIDISRTVELEFTARLGRTPLRGAHYYDAVYLCDPIVR